MSTYVQIYSNSVLSVSQGHAVAQCKLRLYSIRVVLLVNVGLKFTVPEKLNLKKNYFLFELRSRRKAREMERTGSESRNGGLVIVRCGAVRFGSVRVVQLRLNDLALRSAEDATSLCQAATTPQLCHTSQSFSKN